MSEKVLTAGIAVENTAFSFDKIYDYIIPEELLETVKIGCRVKVSFGRGPARQGMVMNIHESEYHAKLKKISELIDKEPVLSKELIKMAFFMKEHYYCRLFEACMAMLPTGLSVKLTYSYSFSGEIPDDLTEDEKIICTYLKARKIPVRKDRLMKILNLKEDSLLESLFRKNILQRTETEQKKIADITVKMLRLCNDDPQQDYTPNQAEVLKVLREIGDVSVKEVCYFTGVSTSVVNHLVKKGICEYYDTVPPKQEILIETPSEYQEIILTEQQQKAYDSLEKDYDSRKPSVTLLYGITGSGKTSVFMKLIDKVNAENKGVICMVPEIALTPQLLGKFQVRYGNKIAVFHSGMSLGKRLEEWRKVRDGQANIAVGTRSAIFAPLQNIGLIIMDEEQEYSYKSSSSPRFHARELAKFRCVENNCPLLLCSATPSVESYCFAQAGRYKFLTLSERYGNAKLPKVTIANMNQESQNMNLGNYSSVLLEALEENLKRKQQAIILLNRRGYNTFISCRECGEVISCPNCSISLTYHSANQRLMCHYCGYSAPPPESCPECHSPKLRYSGSGTQRAEQELQEIFPKAKLLRLDTDSTMQRFAYEQKLSAFRDGEYDIMLGTQMVAKGLDFPNVTLAAVLSADSMLHSQDFRSYEKTFSLLTQVVGRSGRGDIEGRAIIQTYEPENPIIELAAEQNYDEFFKDEISIRKAMLYPPFADIGIAVFIGENCQKTAEAANYFLNELRQLTKEKYQKIPLKILGPSPASVPKINNKYRYRLIFKFRNSKIFRNMMAELLKSFGENRYYSDITAYIDIDPDNII